MPIPNFVPVIGGGFDQVAAQQFGWAGFNQRQEAENLARQQAAEQAQNQWFSNVAQMRAQENARRDSMDMTAAAEARRAASEQANLRFGAQRAAEAKRQFESQQRLEEQKQTWAETKDKTQRKEQNTVLADYAKNLQPQLSSAFQEMKKAEEEQEKAVVSIMSKMSRAQKLANFPPAEKIRLVGGQYSVGIDPGLKTYYTLTDAERLAVTQANDMLAADNAAWLLADKKLKTHSDAYNGYHAQAVKLGMLPIISGSTVLLRVPELGETFGQMVKEAKEAKGDEGGTSLPPIWQPESGTLGASLQAGDFSPINNPALIGTGPPAPGRWAGFNFAEAASPIPGVAQASSAPPYEGPSGLGAVTLGAATASSSPFVPVPGSLPVAFPQVRSPSVSSPGPVPATTSPAADWHFGDWMGPLSGRVRVVSPNGKVGTIPRDQLQAALDAGYKLVR